MSSVFLKIIKGDLPCYKVSETSDFLAILDIRPVTAGHTLVMPKVESEYYFDLENEVLVGLNIFAKEVAIAIKKATSCVRVGMVIEGFEVPHAHIHLIPLNQSTELHFNSNRLTMLKDEFEVMAAKIRAQISN